MRTRNNEPETGKHVNSQMLVLARESRSLTQKELADLTNLSQAEISRYESGLRKVTEEHLDTLSEALRYPKAFFFQPEQRYGLGSNGLHHRKRKLVLTKTLDALIAKVNIFRFVVSRLLDGVTIEHDQRFPQYDVDEFKGDVEHIAELVRAAWKLPPGPIIDLVGTVENAGGVVHLSDFGTNKIDALVQWLPPAPPVFLVNENVPGDRLRFTLAHEIAHLVMHDVPREDMEAEADAFASAFLMPANDIALFFDRVTLPLLTNLKPYWRVSIAALIRRAKDLGRISDRHYRSLYEDMSKMGYRIEEPYPIAIEKPTLLKEIVDTHLTELGYSVHELAEMLALDEADLRTDYLPRANNLRLLRPRKQA